MGDDPTPVQQIAQLKTDITLLTEQLALLKAQAALESARQTNDVLSAKILVDVLKDQTVSQSALGTAQAQLAFAELQGIKAGISGLSLPSGNEGTIKVSAGTAGTALLRSKQPMLQLLDGIADELCSICPNGAVLLTEAQLTAGYAAKFTLDRINDETNKLAQAVQTANEIPKARTAFIPQVVAGAYTLGFTLDTINSLTKLVRTNRQIDVFSADAEAMQLLGYLLESKGKGFIANPAVLGEGAIDKANALLEELRKLGNQVQLANDALAKIQTPTDESKSTLKAEIDRATSLLEGLDPTKKPDAFWAQVSGQVLQEKFGEKQRLLIEVKAQTVQVTESRFLQGERILTMGEIQVAYRVFNADGLLHTSGVFLRASDVDSSQIDEFGMVRWPVT